MTTLLLAAVMAIGSPAAQADPGRVNINTAGIDHLVTLPGVGKAIAGRIVESRQTEGPFRTINDLTRVRGIGDKTLEKLRPMIAVGGGDAGLGSPRPPGAKAERPPTTPKPAAARPPPLAAGAGAGKAFVGAVNVNTATADELRALPGIGPKTASAVVMDRNDRGPFRTVDDLTRVKGIGQGKLAKLRPFVTVGESAKAP